jgi:hypothetical protein
MTISFDTTTLGLDGKSVTFVFRTRREAVTFFRTVKDAGQLRLKLTLSCGSVVATKKAARGELEQR